MFIQIIAPVLVHNVWCAYMFDITAKHTTVIDPCPNKERYEAHVYFHNVVINSLYDCFQSFFKGCVTPPLDQWEMHYPKLTDFQPERQACSHLNLFVYQTTSGDQLVCTRRVLILPCFVPAAARALYACSIYRDLAMFQDGYPC